MELWVDLWKYVVERYPEMLGMLWRHLELVGLATLAAAFVGIGLGILITRRRLRWLGPPVMAICNIGQTVPSLAVVAIMLPILVIGFLPGFFAIFIYILLPIARNTYVGIRGVDPGLMEAARGMGMSAGQILVRLEIPLATYVILAGVRTAMVIAVGVATLATFIGAGGLGDLIDRGISLVNTTYLLAGAIPAALLAIAIELGLGRLERVITPKGLRV